MENKKRKKLDPFVITKMCQQHQALTEPGKVSKFADFSYCDVNGFDFRGFWLLGASFYNADCTGCDFRDMNLSGVIFQGAILTDANFEGSYCQVFFNGIKPMK